MNDTTSWAKPLVFRCTGTKSELLNHVDQYDNNDVVYCSDTNEIYIVSKGELILICGEDDKGHSEIAKEEHRCEYCGTKYFGDQVRCESCGAPL